MIIDIIGVVFHFASLCINCLFILAVFIHSYVSGEMSSNTGGLIRWPVKLLIPIGFSLMIMAGISHLIKCIAFFKGMAPNPLRRAKSSDESYLKSLKSKIKQLIIVLNKGLEND